MSPEERYAELKRRRHQADADLLAFHNGDREEFRKHRAKLDRNHPGWFVNFGFVPA